MFARCQECKKKAAHAAPPNSWQRGDTTHAKKLSQFDRNKDPGRIAPNQQGDMLARFFNLTF
jgi:hypothetical protein